MTRAVHFFMILLIAGSAAFAADDATAQKRKKWMAGAAFNGIAAGIQGEYRPFPLLGARVMGIWVFGTGKKGGPIVDPGELLLSAIAAPVLYVPVPVDFLEPVLFFGVSHSTYRWKSTRVRARGVINDTTFGGGAGLGFIVAPFCRLGINCWINYDYKVRKTLGRKTRGPRRGLVMPFVDVGFLW